MDKNFLDLNEQDLMQVDGGSFLIGCAVVGCIAFFGLGAYNGYKDTKDQKNKPLQIGGDFSMKFLRKSMDSYPTYYKIVGILILMFLLYKFGYLFGKFAANINL